MKRLACLFTLVAALVAVPAATAAQFKVLHHTFTVPDGFTVELVAGTNVALRPVSASFDDQGRLYVTDSSGSNLPPAEQVKNPTHRVLRLEDTNGDGVFDKSVVFADKVMFPQGCLWHAGAVYVAAPPSIWKFTDTDGDGIADKREEWFKGGTLTGCANDIHGPYLGPDGYIYWTKGAFAEQTHTLGNGRTLNDRAAHIYRARPDGSDLGVVMNGGMDNPVEVAFTPEGETLFTSTFIDFSQPGFRDGIAHAVYGGVYGKVNDVLDDGRVKRTSPEVLHPFYQAGPAAECGLCRYESSVFGSDYRDNFFGTTFNLHKVTRHILRPSGGTYASTDSDFLVSDSTDFHPTDVLEDADGSLLVVDTGGWYKLCCPSSQLAKPDLLGAVYRVKKKDAKTLAAGERKAAYQRLIRPPTMADYTLPATLKKAVWKNDPKNAGWFRDILKQNFKGAKGSESLHAARVAAEGLGRLRDKSAVPLLLEATAKFTAPDPIFEHSLIYALIEIAAPAETLAGAKSKNAATHRAALIALDQMDGGGLKPEQVTPLLLSSERRLKETASWIIGHHSDWGGALGGFFSERLREANLSDADRNELAELLARFARTPTVQELMTAALRDAKTTEQSRLTVLRAMAQSSLKETPPAWLAELRNTLSSDNAVLLAEAVATARALPAPKAEVSEFTGALQRVARNSGWPTDLRLNALAAVPKGLANVEPELFDFLRGNLGANTAVLTRRAASEVLGRARLSEEQLGTLTESLKTTGPLEITRLLAAFENSPGENVGLKLVAALRASPAAKSLAAATVQALLGKFPATVQTAATPFIESLNADLAHQTAKLELMLAELTTHPGDVRRGQAIFNSPKAACAACHRIGYLGGNVGPDLTKIGEIRTERDLLEAVVFPSASFVRSYEPVRVTTKAGDDFSGVLRKDAVDEIILATGPGTEARIARSDIAEMRPGTVSVMPAGLDEQLSRQELADLVTFLKRTKWGPQ